MSDAPPKRSISAPQQTARTSGHCIASFVLGCFSFLFCILTALPAFIYGAMGLSEVNRSQGAMKGSGLAIAGMVLAVVGSFVPVLLLLPATGGAREAARRNGCLSNIRQLGLATYSHESSRKHFPAVCTLDDQDMRAVGPGLTTVGATQDDYSWIVQVLSYMEEDILYDEIRKASGKFTAPAFAATVARDTNADTRLDASLGDAHLSTVQIPSLRCPSYSGPYTATLHAMSPATANGYEPAAGNYVAVVATDLGDGGTAAGAVPWKAAYKNWENGGMTTTWGAGGKGLKIGDLRDGIAKTILFVESREEWWNSWFSAGCTWVSATTNDTAAGGISQVGGFVVLASGSLALDYGDDVYYRDTTARCDKYLNVAAGAWGGDTPRVFGPSSEHSGLIHHAFADGHAQSVNDDIDGTIYLHFITRSDGDPVQ